MLNNNDDECCHFVNFTFVLMLFWFVLIYFLWEKTFWMWFSENLPTDILISFIREICSFIPHLSEGEKGIDLLSLTPCSILWIQSGFVILNSDQ